MMTVSVKSNIEEVRRKFSGAPKQVHDAARRAINRTAQQVNTIAVRQLAKETGVKQSKIRELLRIFAANFTSLAATIRVTPRTFNIASFNAKQTKRGVSSSAWGKRKLYRGGFLIQGGETAMIRTGPKRLPIRPLYGPRVHGEFVRNVVNDAMVSTTTTRFPINFAQQLRFALGRIGIKLD